MDFRKDYLNLWSNGFLKTGTDCEMNMEAGYLFEVTIENRKNCGYTEKTAVNKADWWKEESIGRYDGLSLSISDAAVS